jgi:hypothetical protein
MRLITAIASTLLLLGPGIAAAQTTGVSELVLETQDLVLGTDDFIFTVEEIEGTTKHAAPSVPVSPVVKPPVVTPPAAVKPPSLPEEAPPPTLSAHAPTTPVGRRVALVIGISGYKVGPLANPVNDATAMAEALEKQLKFDKVALKLDIGREALLAALRDFSREATSAGLALVYFAGHGTEVGGQNYLIPADAMLAKASDLSLEAIPLATVLAQIEGAQKLKLVILDSCRNNIFPLAGKERGKTRGLARVEPGRNTLIVYAAKHGSVAADGVGGKHSPFTAALLKHIAARHEVQRLFREVRDDVLDATAQQDEPQEPYVYGSLGREQFYLPQ